MPINNVDLVGNFLLNKTLRKKYKIGACTFVCVCVLGAGGM